jgi:hypothetical protein
VTACNARPPVDHLFYNSLVACHLREGHAGPHAWDLGAAQARHRALAELPIETAATVGGLRALLDREDDDLAVRGSVVVWRDDQPVRIVGLAPEYE